MCYCAFVLIKIVNFGIIDRKKEKDLELSRFVIYSMLMGYATEEGRKQLAL